MAKKINEKKICRPLFTINDIVVSSEPSIPTAHTGTMWLPGFLQPVKFKGGRNPRIGRYPFSNPSVTKHPVIGVIVEIIPPSKIIDRFNSYSQFFGKTRRAEIYGTFTELDCEWACFHLYLVAVSAVLFRHDPEDDNGIYGIWNYIDGCRPMTYLGSPHYGIFPEHDLIEADQEVMGNFYDAIASEDDDNENYD